MPSFFLPVRLAAAACAADRAGLDELWLWEDCFLTGGLSTAAIALSHSASLTVGIGVLPVPCENVATSERRSWASVVRTRW